MRSRHRPLMGHLPVQAGRPGYHRLRALRRAPRRRWQRCLPEDRGLPGWVRPWVSHGAGRRGSDYSAVGPSWRNAESNLTL